MTLEVRSSATGRESRVEDAARSLAQRKIIILNSFLEFAEIVRALCEEDYAEAERMRLVCDQLNTHTSAAFYARYPAAEARRLAERVALIYTPVHGSWLNVVEMEFSALVRQCLGHRRLGSMSALRRELEAWVWARNASGCGVSWQFTTADARVKLRRLYPSV